MQLTTSLRGRVRNTSLPKSRALLPLTETLVNAVQAVDARFGDDAAQGLIEVHINRSMQTAMEIDTAQVGRTPLEPILGFEVRDNGEGFTDANMASFQTLDTDYKSRLGCRGVGRLTWLKAFTRVRVDSVYDDADSGQRMRRMFRFTVDEGVAPDPPTPAAGEVTTTVVLDGFKEEFRLNAHKSPTPIARELFAECLWYFLRPGGAPRIVLIDGDQRVDFASLFAEYTTGKTARHHFEVKGKAFDLVSLLLKDSSDVTPKLYWSAASRVVVEENLTNQIPGLHGRLHSDDGDLTFVTFLSSDFLDDAVRADRTAFDLAPSAQGVLNPNEVSMDDIRSATLKVIEGHLTDYLRTSRAAGKERIASFVRDSAPRYRPLLRRFDKLDITVDPNINDRELELELHRQLQRIEQDVFNEGQAVLARSNDLDVAEFEKQLKSYLDKVEDIKKSDLVAYVARRRTVLEILRKVVRADDAGKYVREDVVHSLLMPMRTESNDVPTNASNMWLVDERLAFHEYLASDKTIKSMAITGSDSTREPDIAALRVCDNPMLVSAGDKLPLASIVVVEIKRPMRDDATSDDKNPISQALDYLERIRNGGVKTAAGRPIPQSDRIPGYCYVIADLTPTMITRSKDANLTPAPDGLAYFGYNSARQAYVEVISFDGLVNAATERNRAFFDQLGLPTA